MARMQRWGRVAVMVGVLFWSLGNVIVRGTELEGPRLALWRYIIAAVIYTGAHLWQAGPLNWRDARIAAPAAVAITVEIALFFTAIQRTTMANASVIGSLVPLVLVGIAVRRYKERVPFSVIVATLFGLAGVAAVVYGSASAIRWSLSGDLIAIAALALFAAYYVFAKEAREELSTFSLQTYTMLIGIPVLVVASLLIAGTARPPSGQQWLYPIGLVIFPTSGHFMVNWAHNHVTLTFTSLMALGVPVLSTFGTWLVHGDALTALQVGGIVTVVAVLAYVVVEGERGRFTANASSEAEASPTSS